MDVIFTNIISMFGNVWNTIDQSKLDIYPEWPYGLASIVLEFLGFSSALAHNSLVQPNSMFGIYSVERKWFVTDGMATMVSGGIKILASMGGILQAALAINSNPNA